MKYCINSVFICFSFVASSQSIDIGYNEFDFLPGEKVIFEDNLSSTTSEKILSKWLLEGGKASVIKHDDQLCISIDQYYTGISPLLFSLKSLPDSFSIEYDTWLDNGYDGNPGIEIHLRNGDQEILITPNKHELTVSYPGDGREAKQNPESYFGENKFYDRWVHISIGVYKKHLSVYLDQYKMIDVADTKLKAENVLVSGNSSQEMKILLKNFRIATGFPAKLNFSNGKFTTRAIKFDVDKWVLKPESIVVIKRIYEYLKTNENARLEIGGHTDSDGADEHNIELSQKRAEAVKTQLVDMGISGDRLLAKGYGESMPLENNSTSSAKAMNRRVEFTLVN